MEIISQDELFTVKKPTNFIESKITNYPDILKKIDLFGGEIYHDTLEDFHSYRKRFEEFLIALKPITDEAFHITCLYYKVIEMSSSPFDIRNKHSAETLSKSLYASYMFKKTEAIKQIEEFIKNNDNLNYKEEEERDNLIYKYNLLEEYKDKMQSNLKIRQDKLAHSLDELLIILKKLDNDDTRV